MSKFLKQREVWTRFKKDTQGNFAVIWAFGITATMLSVGAGVDLSTAARVTSTAQSTADQVALTAAVFYSQNERLPENSDEGFVDGQIYRGDDAGFNFPNSVHGGNQGVLIRANYDEDNGQITVKVSGRVRTAFMGAFNQKFETLDFSSEATANFKDVQLKNPASITLVLDNSGSMLWDDKQAVDCESVWVNSYYYGGYWDEQCESPNGAERRIDGLKESVENFMEILDGYVGPQAVTGKRVLRTGMIPYSSIISTSLEVDMEWGVISDGDIDDMIASGGTNSAPPIARAWDWLQDENAVHQDETGEDNPLRYMIFMTDGQNSATPQWFDKDDTEYWRGHYCNWRGCKYYYRGGSSSPNYGLGINWVEGELVSPTDRDSKNTCAAMKAQGVRVFTIGFALAPGNYMDNYGSGGHATIPASTTDAAYAMLSDCASSPDDFVPAESVETLDAAFAIIGKSIVEDVVRLSH